MSTLLKPILRALALSTALATAANATGPTDPEPTLPDFPEHTISEEDQSMNSSVGGRRAFADNCFFSSDNGAHTGSTRTPSEEFCHAISAAGAVSGEDTLTIFEKADGTISVQACTKAGLRTLSSSATHSSVEPYGPSCKDTSERVNGLVLNR